MYKICMDPSIFQNIQYNIKPELELSASHSNEEH